MGFLQLLKQQYKLQIETDQILQAEVMNNNSSEIILLYEDHVQVWNLDIQKKIRTSISDPTIYFWSILCPMDGLSFAFVSLLECEPWLGTYSFVDNKINKVVDLPPDQENYSKIVYFEKTKELAIDARGKEHRLLVWDGKELAEQKLDENSSVERYSNEGLVIFSTQNRVTGFDIQKGKTDIKKYAIAGIEEGTIVAVQEYSETEAIVAVVHNGKTSTVLLYSLATGNTVREEKVDFPVDNLVRLGDYWVAICTSEEEGDSHLKVQACFGEGQNSVIQTPIERWIRYWNDFVPIITLSHTVEQTELRECHMEVVRCAPKRSIYIKLMEDTGLIADFGAEVVKHTINNF